MQSFSETLHDGFDQVLRLAGPPLVDEHSQFQHIQIFDTVANGRVLALDGIVQLSDKDEAAYSEMLAHLPIVEHGDVRRVLVVGGGDGAVAEEVLRHAGVERVDLVDIDPRVVELSRQHLAHVNRGAFDDPRLAYHAEDAFAFLGRAGQDVYDFVIADRPDPVGPAESLFARAFYGRLQNALREGGVAVFQTGCPFFQADELAETWRHLDASFPDIGVYLTVVPTYTGGFMALTWGSKGLSLGACEPETLRSRFQASGVATDYYTPEIHKAAFALPAWIARLLPPREG